MIEDAATESIQDIMDDFQDIEMAQASNIVHLDPSQPGRSNLSRTSLKDILDR